MDLNELIKSLRVKIKKKEEIYGIGSSTYYKTIVAYLVKLKRYEDAYKELHNLELSPQNEDTSGILTCLGIIDKHLKEVLK